jgi:rhodanese-related sulfurtransferase
MDAQAIDVVDDEELFTLKGIKDISELDGVAEVNLEEATPDQFGEGSESDVDSDDAESIDSNAGVENLDDDRKYLQVCGVGFLCALFVCAVGRYACTRCGL